MHSVIMTGRAVKDPEMSYTNDGKAYTNFSIAVDKFSSGQKSADFFNCVCFDKTAENVSNYVRKGRQVLIEARLDVKTYYWKKSLDKLKELGVSDREAEVLSRRENVSLICYRVEFLGSVNSSSDIPISDLEPSEVSATETEWRPF